MEELARDAGLSSLRARILGMIASFKDGWIYRRTLADLAKCSVRTVQRAITQAKLEGLLGVARAKKNEVPPGAKGPIPSGWSHRWPIGRDLAGEALKQAVAAAKAAALARLAARRPAKQERVGAALRAEKTAAELEERRRDAKRRLAELEAQWAAEDARAGPGHHN
jgi:hypothetical protein